MPATSGRELGTIAKGGHEGQKPIEQVGRTTTRRVAKRFQPVELVQEQLVGEMVEGGVNRGRRAGGRVTIRRRQCREGKSGGIQHDLMVPDPDRMAGETAGVPGGKDVRSREEGNAGRAQRGGSGLMIPRPIPTLATPAPTVATLCTTASAHQSHQKPKERGASELGRRIRGKAWFLSATWKGNAQRWNAIRKETSKGELPSQEECASTDWQCRTQELRPSSALDLNTSNFNASQVAALDAGSKEVGREWSCEWTEDVGSTVNTEKQVESGQVPINQSKPWESRDTACVKGCGVVNSERDKQGKELRGSIHRPIEGAASGSNGTKGMGEEINKSGRITKADGKKWVKNEQLFPTWETRKHGSLAGGISSTNEEHGVWEGRERCIERRRMIYQIKEIRGRAVDWLANGSTAPEEGRNPKSERIVRPGARRDWREEEPGGLEIRQPIGSVASVNSDRVANKATRNWITKEDRSEGRITNPTNNLGTGAKSTNEGKGITNSSERERVENGRTPVDQLWRGITEEAEGSTRKESRLLSQDEGKGSLREVREPKRATGCHRVSDNPSTSERSAAPDAMADETARKGRGLPNREGEEGKCRSFVGGATGRSASARRSRGTRKWKGWRWIAKPGGARRYNERVEEVDYPAGRDGREGREHDRPGDHDEGTDRAVGSQKLSERCRKNLASIIIDYN
ncbi:hypothetical protein BJ322DRAFT_1025602 [Thelephora terrestris]|uniref:Uncharacterized protein n=1 Tax=Thelephora terrestris TaxID=56493 RepID=A0A9P6L0V4_9AGAM|nr:hypothetical protein BJ322DRAFT_1025602 [Thelephora terrestris]